MISMTASIKATAEKARKRKEQEKLRENREQQKIEAKLAAKANGSPSKGISIARTQNVRKVEVDSNPFGAIFKVDHRLFTCLYP